METTWEEIEQKVKAIIVDELGVEESQVTFDARIIDDLGGDSLDAIDITMRFEEEFHLEISPDESDRVRTVEDIMRFLVRALPEQTEAKITSRVLAFRVSRDGTIRVGLQTSDGAWIYADGVSFLPAGIYTTIFSKWGEVLRELEEMINSPTVKETDLQSFFERYPELLKCDEYDVIVPQARIISEETGWQADFVLHPFDQTSFCKVLELKVPTLGTSRPPKHGHLQIYAELVAAINQLRDYGDAFQNPLTRRRFRDTYKIDVFKPDLQLIAGRKWDVMHMQNMLEVQRRNGIKVDDWDSCLEKLRRRFT